MMGLLFPTKKAAKEKVPFRASDYIMETSLFGNELKENGKFAVVVSLDPYKVRNSFAEIEVKDGMVVKIK